MRMMPFRSSASMSENARLSPDLEHRSHFASSGYGLLRTYALPHLNQ